MAGLGSGLANKLSGESFKEAFGIAAVNHFMYNLFSTYLYIKTLDAISKTKHPHIYATLFQFGFFGMVYTYHNYVDTPFPLAAVAPSTIYGLYFVNNYVDKRGDPFTTEVQEPELSDT